MADEELKTIITASVKTLKRKWNMVKIKSFKKNISWESFDITLFFCSFKNVAHQATKLQWAVQLSMESDSVK